VAQGRESDVLELHMHDPLCVYYAMLDDQSRKRFIIERNTDIRVEYKGSWTKGMTVLDQRNRGEQMDHRIDGIEDRIRGEDIIAADYNDVDDDEGHWRSNKGNRVNIVWASGVVDDNNQKTVEDICNIIWRLNN
jgi:hypothetical protein